MQWYQWVLMWVLTVLLGSVVLTVTMVSDVELYFMVVVIASLCGSPTLVLVLALNEYLKRKMDGDTYRSQILWWHVGIAVLNLMGLLIIDGSFKELVLAVAGCYAPIGILLTYAMSSRVLRLKEEDGFEQKASLDKA